MILLDTNAVIWLAQGHKRTRPLGRFQRLYLSPATILELQFLVEADRLRLASGVAIASLADDPRWTLDDIPSGKWFGAAVELAWTRDPFDRLIVAHARVRGWKLATADTALIARLTPAGCVPL